MREVAAAVARRAMYLAQKSDAVEDVQWVRAHVALLRNDIDTLTRWAAGLGCPATDRLTPTECDILLGYAQVDRDERQGHFLDFSSGGALTRARTKLVDQGLLVNGKPYLTDAGQALVAQLERHH